MATSKSEAGARGVAEALDQNKKVAEEVKDAADELAVVHAVLETQLPNQASAADVAQAVAQTDQLEKRLAESGKTLDEVNRKLEKTLNSP
jgi:ABC-type Fe3+-citrate transport system substrate-binding protein